jgi:hypothetical protein
LETATAVDNGGCNYYNILQHAYTVEGVDFEKFFISKLYHFAIVVSMGRYP